MPINDITLPGKSAGVSEQPAVGLNPRLTFGFLLGLSVITLGLGFWQIGRAIKAPFENRTVGAGLAPAQNGQGQALPLQEDDAATLAALRSKDTDQDGLNDYDELYVFRSSPYLPDTDSDGFKDGEEVEKGYDPNCPSGQNCRGVASGSDEVDTGQGTATSPGAVDILGLPVPDEQSGNFGALLNQLDQFDESSLEQSFNGSAEGLTAAQLREMLLESGGVDKATLDQFDDASLMEIYQETLQSEKNPAGSK